MGPEGLDKMQILIQDGDGLHMKDRIESHMLKYSFGTIYKYELMLSQMLLGYFNKQYNSASINIALKFRQYVAYLRRYFLVSYPISVACYFHFLLPCFNIPGYLEFLPCIFP